MVEIAEALRRGRVGCGLSCQELADLAGVDPLALAGYESGAQAPPEGTFVRLLAVMGEALDARHARLAPPKAGDRGFGEALRLRREWAGMTIADLAVRADVAPDRLAALERSTAPYEWSAWDQCMAACLPPRPPGWDDGHEQDSRLPVSGRAPRSPGYWDLIDGWLDEWRPDWYSQRRAAAPT